MDGDGDLDLAVVYELMASVSVRLNTGDGTFGEEATYDVGNEPWGMSIGDLDGDGDADLVVANRVSGNISVLFNNGDGTFADQITFEVGGGDFAAPSSVALGDIDGDGDLDLASANIKSFNLSVLLNNGEGTFGQEITYPVFLAQDVIFVDLDHDGDLDLVLGVVGDASVMVLLNNGAGIFDNDAFYGVSQAALSKTWTVMAIWTSPSSTS